MPGPDEDLVFPANEDFQPVAGFETRFTVHHAGRDFIHHWKVVSADVNSILLHQWRYEGYPGNALLEWQLVPEAPGTRVNLAHSGLLSFQPDKHPELSSENFTRGWTQFLQILENFCIESESKPG